MGKKSKRAKKKSAPVKAPDEKNGFLSSIVQHPIISLLVILATFIALYFAIFPRPDALLNSKIDKIADNAEFLTNASSNRAVPDASLSVFPYAYPVHKEPFETDFVLENKGSFAVQDISCNFMQRKTVFANGFTMMSNNFFGGIYVKELHAGQQTTLHSSNAHDGIGSGTIKYAELQITIMFTCGLPLKKQTRSFDFFTKPQDNGELIWYPLGN